MHADTTKSASNIHQRIRIGPRLPQHGQRFAVGFGGHGSTAPVVGSPTNAFGSLPITSPRISVPGSSLAIRVARVTPLYNTSTPSVPSYTHGAGIPATERPNN